MNSQNYTPVRTPFDQRKGAAKVLRTPGDQRSGDIAEARTPGDQREFGGKAPKSHLCKFI